MNQNLSVPVIDEIREARCRISARFAHDPAQLVAYYMELQPGRVRIAHLKPYLNMAHTWMD